MIRKAVIVLLTLGATVVAVVSMWNFRSSWKSISFDVWSGARSHVTVFVSCDGVIHLCIIRPAASPTSVWRIHRFGFTWYSQNEGVLLGKPGARCRHYFAPCWLLTLLLGAYPTIALIRGQLRRRRARTGHCLKCGYDLTGNVSGVCPECGTKIGKS